jgi:hypothetical protein
MLICVSAFTATAARTHIASEIAAQTYVSVVSECLSIMLPAFSGDLSVNS